ncbi:MAG TPA: hypothetical protein ENK47_01125 [Euryarchaeota archaeon]|nr:hypothetical protein [Euryarchaeota archaeon]
MFDTSFIEQLLGTRTKIRILKVLITDNGHLSRNRLVGLTRTGIRSVYEQTDQLIALGALKETEGKISIDQDFPYLDQLRDLLFLSEDYMNNIQTVLRSIDRILGIDYYITGYASACQNGMPIDVDERSILVMVKEHNKRKERMLQTIKDCTNLKVGWRPTNIIPEDVKRETLFGVEVWISSVERGMVDSIKLDECDHYPIFLLLVQNIVNGSIDLQKIMEYAEDQDMDHIFGPAILAISDRLSDIDLPINIKKGEDPEIRKSVNLALNTVLG